MSEANPSSPPPTELEALGVVEFMNCLNIQGLHMETCHVVSETVI